MFEELVSIVFFLMIFTAVLFLAFVFTKYVGSKASKAFKGRYINIVDSVNLGLDKRILLVKVADQYILIASSGKSLQYLATINMDENGEETVIEPSPVPFEFKAVFDKYLSTLKGIKLPERIKSPGRQNTMDKPVSENVFKSNLSRLRTITKRVETNDDITNEENGKEQ